MKKELNCGPFLMLALVAVIVAGGLLSCSSGGDSQAEFRQEVETLQRKTIPPDAEVLARTGPVRSNWSVKASWEFETTMDRAAYSKWVNAQLVPEFKATTTETRLAFSKYEDGDTHSIECEFSLTREKTHVRVVFGAFPD